MSDRQQLIERAREALARWAVVGMAPDGERLFHALRDLLAAVEAGDARTPVPPELLEQAQAERDHLRRALEWTIATMQGADKYQCPRPCPEGQHDEDGRCIGTLKGCWNIAALAATEEAPDE